MSARSYDLARYGAGLRLWSCCVGDDSEYSEYGDHWRLVWARDREQAAALARDLCGEGDDVEVAVGGPKDVPARPLAAWPHEERRDAVAREAEWGQEGDRTCDWCGRHDFDADVWRVCDECGVCATCGHNPHPSGNCASEDFAREPGEDPLLPVRA